MISVNLHDQSGTTHRQHCRGEYLSKYTQEKTGNKSQNNM